MRGAKVDQSKTIHVEKKQEMIDGCFLFLGDLADATVSLHLFTVISLLA